MWKDFVRNYLSFSRRQRISIVILCILILLCWTVPMLFRYLNKDTPQDFTAFQKEVALFRAQQDSLKQTASHDAGKEENIFNINELPEPFPFDPNTLSPSGWRKLGMPLRVTTTIQHYLAAGGHFYQKEDLKKIYGLPDKMYRHLAPYMTIAKQPEKAQKRAAYSSYPAPKKKKVLTHFSKHVPFFKKRVVEINKADSAGWVRLRGIGPVLSGRIIRFRKALGGFYSIDQIAEVYGLPDSTFQNIKQQLKISKVPLKKLNINTATVDELKSHPYIKYRLAASIKAFRDMHGPYDSVKDLKQLQLVDDQIYRKLAPYLTVKIKKKEE